MQYKLDNIFLHTITHTHTHTHTHTQVYTHVNLGVIRSEGKEDPEVIIVRIPLVKPIEYVAWAGVTEYGLNILVEMCSKHGQEL